MFNQYSYKIKFKFMLVLFLMLSIASYKRSFSSLISVVKENRMLSNKIDLLSKKAKSTNQLSSEIAILDKLIGKEGINKDNIQQEIISFLLKNSSNVSINDMQPIHEFVEESYKVYTYQLDLTGSFNQLIKIVYDFEKQFDYSKIVSTKFYTAKKNNKTENLHLKIIFQKYENNK